MKAFACEGVKRHHWADNAFGMIIEKIITQRHKNELFHLKLQSSDIQILATADGVYRPNSWHNCGSMLRQDAQLVLDRVSSNYRQFESLSDGD